MTAASSGVSLGHTCVFLDVLTSDLSQNGKNCCVLKTTWVISRYACENHVKNTERCFIFC